MSIGTEFDRAKLLRMIERDSNLLNTILKENPALLDYIFSDAEIRRKYVKVPSDLEAKLTEASHRTGVAEGILIGLGLALLLAIIFGDSSSH